MTNFVEFQDRVDAGRQLVTRLGTVLRGKVIVLGLPRGGVPVAFEVAQHLVAPLDVVVVRKFGASQVVLAVPVAPEGWRFRMHNEADRFFSVVECAEFYAVGQFYDEFPPVSDEEFLVLLKTARGLARV